MRQFYILSMLLLCSSMLIAQSSDKMPLDHNRFITGAEELPEVEIIPESAPAVANIATIGHTYWDMQSIGSVGNRTGICVDGSMYFTWIKAYDWQTLNDSSLVYYNWNGGSGHWPSNEEGEPLSGYQPSLFPSLDIFNENYHALAFQSFNWDTMGVIFLAEGYYHDDWYHHIVPNQVFPQMDDYPGYCLWPQVAVDRNNVIHIIMHENTGDGPLRLAYTQSDDGGRNWTDPVVIDTCTVIGAMIEASPASDKVVIAYHKPSDLSSQWHNDIVYIESEDGINWDFENGKVNITNYANDDDSLWAYTDLDLMIDSHDNINLAWNAQWTTQEDVYYRTYLYFFNEDIGTLDEVCHHPDSTWADIQPTWHRPICKMNMTQIDNGNYVIAWTQYDTLDVSADGFGNGDIYYSIAYFGYHYWEQPVNFTATSSPGCAPGDCASEVYVSMVSNMHDELFMEYINDQDPGSAMLGEGAATNNEVKYHDEYFCIIDGFGGTLSGNITEGDSVTPVENVLVEVLYTTASSLTGDNGIYSVYPEAGEHSIKVSKPGYRTQFFHYIYVSEYHSFLNIVMDATTGIDDNSPLPRELSLSQNYPNPFNQTTTISFELPEPEQVSLEIYDITGALVETLIKEHLPAGVHKINWNADKLASGTYFYKLKAGELSKINKAVLIK